MVHAEKKISKLVLMCLIIAVIGSFTVSTCETFYFNKINKNSLGSSSFFSSVGHAVDWLAEDITTIGKTNRHSSSQLRGGLLSVFAITVITGAAMNLVKSNLKIIKKNNIPIIKNLIVLKLRI
jgi:uncharacterized membrane protein YkvI